MKQLHELKEGEDYYLNEEGFVVLTAKYHLDKGSCCGNGCRHCPYHYEQVPPIQRRELLAGRKSKGVNG